MIRKQLSNVVWAVTAILAAGLLGSSELRAADAPQADRGDRPNRGDRGDRGGRGGGAMLDEQQRQLLREAMMKDRDQIRTLDEKLRAAQKEFLQAALAEKQDEKVLREKAEAVSKVQVEMMVLRAKAMSAVAPTLKPEQKEQLENSRFGMMMMMGGGFEMGGGPGFGAGGPGAPGERGNRGDRPARNR